MGKWWYYYHTVCVLFTAYERKIRNNMTAYNILSALLSAPLKGFDILDLKTLESEFVENTISPKFYKVYLSELISGKWKYNELSEIISGNIFKIIIDLNITPADINVLNGLIGGCNPLDYSLEWENGKNFSQEISEVELSVFDMEKAIQKYIELLDIPNKAEVTEYVLRLYEKAQS